MAREPKLRKDGQPYRSSRGKKNPIANQENWRQKLARQRIKFDDDQKDIYVEALRKSGRRGVAANAADVTPVTANKHYENDPDFAERVDIALEDYTANVAAEVVRRGQVGWEEPIFHKGARAVEPVLNEDGTQRMTEAGDPVLRYTSVTKFSDRLLELEAKRVDPAYREKQTIDLSGGGGGIIVVPAGQTPEEEIAEAERVNAEAVAKREAEARELASKPKNVVGR